MSEFVPTVTISLEEYLKFKEALDDKDAEIKSLSTKISRYRKILSSSTKSLEESAIMSMLAKSIEDGICQPPKVIIEDRRSASLIDDPYVNSDMRTVTVMFKVKE